MLFDCLFYKERSISKRVPHLMRRMLCVIWEMSIWFSFILTNRVIAIYFRCRLRVLDSFGTQAEFNDPLYFNTHKQSLGGKPKNVWGGHLLNLRQFFTMFRRRLTKLFRPRTTLTFVCLAHTPDNSFLGFVVETYTNDAMTEAAQYRKNWSLVYGKEAYMWKVGGTQLYRSVVIHKP